MPHLYWRKLVPMVVLATVLGGPMSGTAQSPVTGAAGAGAISGVVVDARAGRPVAGVLVHLGAPAPVAGGDQFTDSKGRFVFVNLAPSDSYIIQTSKPGYLDGGFGRRAGIEQLVRIDLDTGEWFDHARIEMRRPSAISGSVRDERGEPIVDAPVRVLRQIFVGGQRQLAAGSPVSTDDRGRYRTAGLVAGAYIVCVPSVQITSPRVMARNRADTPAATSEPGLVDGSHRLTLGRFATPPPRSGGASWAYPSRCYPDAAGTPDAAAIELFDGDEREAVDISLVPVPAVTVSGRIDGPADALGNLVLRLIPAAEADLAAGAETATTTIEGDGRFTFLNVSANQYTIDARRTVSMFQNNGFAIAPSSSLPPGFTIENMSKAGVRSATPGTDFATYGLAGKNAYYGRATVSVGTRDVTDVRVAMRRGVTVSGRIVWDGPPRPISDGTPLVSAEPAGGRASQGSAMGSVTAGAFALEGLLPGDYFLSFAGLKGSIKSITHNGRDYTDSPLDAFAGHDVEGVMITLTNSTTGVTGQVKDRTGNGIASAAVIAFPAERAQWVGYGFTPRRMRSTLVDQNGTYRFTDLPPGDYCFIAVDDASANAWQDPAFLDAAVALATRVSIDWGSSQTQDLLFSRVN